MDLIGDMDILLTEIDFVYGKLRRIILLHRYTVDMLVDVTMCCTVLLKIWKIN